MTVLPTFLIIGAMKAGTTSLYRYLRTHPQIFMPEPKEVDFFVAEKNWDKGLAWYEKQFEAGASARARGEASPLYTMYPAFAGIPQRIARIVPDVKLVYVLRHPVERVRSHYQHMLVRGLERRPLEVAVTEDAGYLDCSRYALQIERYLEWFPRESLLLITAENLRHRRMDTLRAVCEFIGVETDWSHADLGKEFYPSWARHSLLGLRRKLARLPGYTIAARLTPPRAKGLYRRFMARGSSSQIAMPDAVRRHIEAELREDIAHLRVYLGNVVDAWGIATD